MLYVHVYNRYDIFLNSGSRRMTSTRNTGSSPALSNQPETGDFTTNFAPKGDMKLYLQVIASIILDDAEESWN